MTEKHSPVRCMVTIVDRGRGARVAQICRAHHAPVQLALLGHGTASAEIMDWLGLDEPEKDIVLGLLPEERVKPLLAELTAALGLFAPGRGIAFTAPLSGISAAAHQRVAGDAARSQSNAEKEVLPVAQDSRFELIVSVVEHGFSADVMDAARAAGASGGTVARARGLGGEEAQRFLNITIQPEKEIVLILTSAAQKQAIMRAICSEVFARTGERGIAFSLPVSDVTGLNLARLTQEDADPSQ